MNQENLERRVLVVEDRPEYRAAAEAFFQTQQNVHVDYAQDYEEGMRLLETRPDAVISDCFMPRRTGSDDTELGLKVIWELDEGEHEEGVKEAEELREKVFYIKLGEH